MKTRMFAVSVGNWIEIKRVKGPLYCYISKLKKNNIMLRSVVYSGGECVACIPRIRWYMFGGNVKLPKGIVELSPRLAKRVLKEICK